MRVDDSFPCPSRGVGSIRPSGYLLRFSNRFIGGLFPSIMPAPTSPPVFQSFAVVGLTEVLRYFIVCLQDACHEQRR